MFLFCLLLLATIPQADQNLKPHFIKSGVSEQDLRSDTLKILAVRVEFQLDDDETTTGEGKFDLSKAKVPTIDPPPHDRHYFESQLEALANYYKSVSNGKLILKGKVYPQAPKGAYTLPHKMAYYSPDGPEELLNQRLAELFRDALTAADTSDTIYFPHYDCFIVFHAGVGREVSYSTAPHDIPSVFLSYKDLKSTLGEGDPNYPGIPVMDSTFFIREGIILPETQNLEDREFGLLGTAALMFGHQLGLPSLFDTERGRPGIGCWGLMDQGSGNFNGLLPALPCAWSRVFLGWEKPVDVTQLPPEQWKGLKVAAPKIIGEPRIYKIPINSKEYFLIENRQQDVNKDGIAVGWDENGQRVEFRFREENGALVPYLVAEDTIGVIVRVEEYDFGLPGSGILIWHVDENVIQANYEENRVNADPDHRGVDLEEADGAQDIGHYYGLFGLGGYATGSAEDTFWSGNQAHKEANNSDEVAFTPYTAPDSRSNSGADSHIYITNLSDIDSIMSFDLAIDYHQQGFPQLIGQQVGSNSLAFGDLDRDGANEIVISSRGWETIVYDSIGWMGYAGGKIYTWRSDGSKFIPNEDSTAIFSETEQLPYPHLSGCVFSSPALGDLNGNGDLEVVVGAVGVGTWKVGLNDISHKIGGRLYAWKPLDADADGRADPLFLAETEGIIHCSPLIATLKPDLPGRQVVVGDEEGNLLAVTGQGEGLWRRKLDNKPIRGLSSYGSGEVDSLVVTSLSGKVFLMDGQGEIIWERNVESEVSGSPAVGDLNHDGTLDIVVVTKEGKVFSFDRRGDLLSGFPASLGGYNITSSPALGDIDDDGYLEIVITGEKQIFALNHNGTLVNSFPFEIRDGRFSSSPILGDIQGDGDIEIIVGTSEGQLIAYHHTGEIVAGFPLSTGGALRSTPALLDLDGDEDIEVAVGCDDGYLYVWDLPGKYDPQNIPWGCYLHDPQHSGINPQIVEVKPPSGELIPPSSVYNYPNPTEGSFTTIRYTLNYPAEVRIKIYDLAGDLVVELSGPGLPGTENEVVWNLEGVESGVYLARVEAKGGGKESFSIIKIAVVK